MPANAQSVSEQIREMLGSHQSVSHFRISTSAVEFNLFAENEEELNEKKELLERHGFEILTTKLLDTPPAAIGKSEAIKEAVELFDEERFWESHEVLEQAWRLSRGTEREMLQSVILTAAAFVHYQKGEPEVCLSVLKRARAKMGHELLDKPLDFARLRASVDTILVLGRIQPFKIRN